MCTELSVSARWLLLYLITYTLLECECSVISVVAVLLMASLGVIAFLDLLKVRNE